MRLVRWLLAGGAVVLIVLIFRPAATSDVASTMPPTAEQVPAVPDEPLRELAWFAPLWHRDLQQELFPPSQAAQESEPPPPPKPLPVLLGTFIEADRQFAHLRNNAGRIQVLTVGDDVDGYAISAIERGSVMLLRGAATYRLELQQPKPQLTIRTVTSTP